MKNEFFAVFLLWFKRELMESDSAVWFNYFKVFYLEGALNAKIISCLITLSLDCQNYLNFISVIE